MRNSIGTFGFCVQEALGRPLAWCPCRHYVGEVLLTHVWNDLGVEVSKGPNVSIFQRYNRNLITLNELSIFL